MAHLRLRCFGEWFDHFFKLDALAMSWVMAFDGVLFELLATHDCNQ
jgi:hypothetical protein